MSILSGAVLLFLSILTTTTSAETIHIHDGATLINYLCPSSGTLPPNTNLVIGSSLQLPIKEDQFCLVENTTNISIAASEELLNSEEPYVTITCERDTGFGFFNVSHLTIRSVYFKNCDHVIPETATRLLNEPDQYWKFNNVSTSLIFNHCFNIKLYNILVNDNPDITFGIIGVNLCGNSNIYSVVLGDHPKSSMLICFIDSTMSQACSGDLYYTSNQLSKDGFPDEPLPLDQADMNIRASRFSAYALAIFMTQQNFDINLNVHIEPSFQYESLGNLNVIMCFVNSQTASLVTFQGYPHNVCGNKSSNHLVPIKLDVLFHEFSSFNTSTELVSSPLFIHNTGFTVDFVNHSQRVLSIYKYTTELSHQIKIQNVSWCKSEDDDPDYFFDNEYLLAHNEGDCYLLQLKLSDLSMKFYYNLQDMVYFHNINVSFDGTNFFQSPQHYTGGTVYSAGSNVMLSGNYTFTSSLYTAGDIFKCVDSNITINGICTMTAIGSSTGHIISSTNSNVTISGNFTMTQLNLYFAAIALDESSILFFQEPLLAVFSNIESSESVLMVPGSVQINPSKKYSLDNVTEIDISLQFHNITLGFSKTLLHLPKFNFLTKQLSPNLLFEADTWDSEHSQYAYTTLIDTIFEEIDDLDKYYSLSNGLCIKLRGQPPWKCMYIDLPYYNKKENINAVYPLSTHIHPGADTFSTKLDIFSEKIFEYSYYIEEFKHLHCNYSSYRLSSNLTLFSHREYYCADSSYGIDPILMLVNYSQSFIMNISNLPILKVNVYPNCPFGFYLIENSYCECYCDCIEPLQKLDYSCDISAHHIISPPKFWTQPVDNTTFMIGKYCPSNYCNPLQLSISLTNYTPGYSCLNSSNRAGVLCGECKENYSAVFGSDVCYSYCTYLHLLTLPVYALAGLLLIVLLFGLRLTVATGTINGVIFYANMIGLVMQKLTENHSGIHLSIFHVIISLLNLDLGFPLCFYKGMTPAAKIGFQFIFPLYLWSIVIGLVVISKYSIKISNLTSKLSIQVLSTLFYLSFSKLVRVVIDIITFTQIQRISYDDSTELNYAIEHSYVWFHNGVNYGRGVHGVYLFLVAMTCLCFLLPYIIFTTFSYYMGRFRIINKFRPFGDAYGGPFKNKFKFWFGLRLWITFLLYSLHGVLRGTYNDIMLILHLVIIGLLIYLQTIYRPFKNSLVGWMDHFFMINYWLIVEFYLILEQDSFIYIYLILITAATIALLSVFVAHLFWMKNQNYMTKLRIKFGRRFSECTPILRENKIDYENDELFDAADVRIQRNVSKISYSTCS